MGKISYSGPEGAAATATAATPAPQGRIPLAIVGGEITTKAHVNYREIAQETETYPISNQTTKLITSTKY